MRESSLRHANLHSADIRDVELDGANVTNTLLDAATLALILPQEEEEHSAASLLSHYVQNLSSNGQ